MARKKATPRKRAPKVATITKEMILSKAIPWGYTLKIGTYTETYCDRIAKVLGIELQTGTTIRYDMVLTPITQLRACTVETDLKTGKETILKPPTPAKK